jgi:hypothetical protein
MDNKKVFKGIRIHEVGSDVKPYLARTEKECRDSVDLSAYRAAMEIMDMVTMGFVIAVPEWYEE